MSESERSPFFKAVTRAASVATSQFDKIDPMLFEQLPRELQKKFLRNGMHGLGARSFEEAAALYQTVPISVRQAGPKAVKEFLEGKHFSHVMPHSQGGSGEATNILFEHAKPNQVRGGKPMTRQAQWRVNATNAGSGFKVAVSNASRVGLQTAAFSAAFEAFSVIPDQVRRYRRGEVTVNQAAWVSTKRIAIQGGKGYLLGAGSHLATTALIGLGVGTALASVVVPVGLIAAGAAWAWQRSQSEKSSHALEIPYVEALTARANYQAGGSLVLVPRIL
jgi:hypothetical protein